MNSKFLIPAIIALMGFSYSAWADDQDDDGEVTISLMPASADESPDAVTKQISLPDVINLVGNTQAQESVKKRAEQALKDAAEKGNGGREHGWSHANEARMQAQDMADEAKARNENRSRGEANRPERPEPPDPPNTPPSRD